VAFAGPCTIRQARDNWSSLQAAMSEVGPLDVDISEVAAADLSFVQLLESARVSARSAGGRLALSAPAAGAVLQVLERGGFLGPNDAERVAFWTHQGVVG
jgi:ABC-type transporter Mla MlaB component